MNKQSKPKKCKICKGLFIQKTTTQVVCSYQCAIKIAEIKKEKKKIQEQKDWNKKKKIIKDKLETPSDRRNKLQKVFNTWIRLRDEGLPCISCDRPMNGKKVHAGHFFSVGRFPELRYDLDNCHAQCEWCNVYLHGNGALYRVNLEKRIGIDRLNDLEKRRDIPKNYLDHEISDLLEHYKNLVKEKKNKKK